MIRRAIPHPVDFTRYHPDGSNWREVSRLIFDEERTQEEVERVIPRGHIATWNGWDVGVYDPEGFALDFAVIEVEHVTTVEHTYTRFHVERVRRSRKRETATFHDGSQWAGPWADMPARTSPPPG